MRVVRCSNKHTNFFVIIPVYNCIRYLQNSVNSVLSQGVEEISIVLVDDGSTDGSAAMCDKLAEENNCIHIIHKTNGGVSSARNCALEYVFNIGVGGYVTFLDADDFWYPGFFDESVRNKLHQGYSLVGYQSCFCNKDCTKRERLTPMDEGEHLGGTDSVYLHSHQHFGAMFYSVALLKEHHVTFPLARYCEDRAFAMQCMYLADTVWLENKLLYGYRQHQASAVHNRTFGISHFSPIIETWLNSDAKMAPLSNAKRGVLLQGRILARLYIMDMIDEHYQIFGSKEEINAFMESKPEYIELLKSDLGPQILTDRYNHMTRNPVAYRIKNRIVGVYFYIVRKITSWPIIRRLIDYRKYRFEM